MPAWKHQRYRGSTASFQAQNHQKEGEREKEKEREEGKERGDRPSSSPKASERAYRVAVEVQKQTAVAFRPTCTKRSDHITPSASGGGTA